MKGKNVFDALARLDDNLIDGIISNRNEINAQGNKAATSAGKAPGKKPGKAWWIIAVAAVLVIAAVSASLPAFYRNPGIPAVTSIADPNDQGQILPPWKTGELRLTAMVYRNTPETSMTSSTGSQARFRLLSAGLENQGTATVPATDEPEMPDAPETDDAETLDPVVSEAQPEEPINPAETVTVSISPNTKVSAYSGTDLIRIKMLEGEHADCDSVWYDVINDCIVCLSCRIREAIKATPEYIDSCIRLMIESGMIPEEALFAGDTEGIYVSFYELLDNENAYKCFKSGKKPTISSLGLSGTEADSELTRDVLSRYEYPSVCVVEYGTDPGKCLFTLTNADKSLSYGSYILEFETGKLTALDGNHAGDPRWSYNGIYYSSNKPSANLALASEILISEDYSRIVAEVPYYVWVLNYDRETNIYAPSYASSTIMVYSVGKEPRSLLESYDFTSTSAPSPSGGLAERNGVISFAVSNGNYGFSVNGGEVFFLRGERLMLTKTLDGTPSVFMRTDGKVNAYRLSADGAVEMSEAKISDNFSVFDRSVLVGGVYIDLTTGSETRIAPDPIVSVVSRNGRYAYMYLGNGGISCFDLLSGDSGFIPIDAEFERQIMREQNVRFCLFLSGNDKELLLAYFKDGQLTFDRAAYLSACSDRDKYMFISIGDSRQAVSSFNHNLASVISFFRLEGQSITITGTKEFQAIGRFFAAKILDKLLTPEMTQAHNFEISKKLSDPVFLADVAEAIIPYMDYSGNVARVAPATLRDLMNGTAIGNFDDRFNTIVPFFDREMYLSLETTDTAETAKRKIARMIANNVTRLVTGYLSPDDDMRDTDLRNIEYAKQWRHYDYLEALYVDLDLLDSFYSAFNKDLDTAAAEKLRTGLIELIIPLLPEPHSSRDGSTYGLYRRELIQIYNALWDRIFSFAVNDASYPEFLTSGDFLDHPYVKDYYVGRSNVLYGVVSLEYQREVDLFLLKSLLSELSFEKTDVTMLCEAVIEINEIPLLSAGRDNDGNIYMTSFGYTARLTEEQLERFINLCSTGKRPDFEENTTYYLYRQMKRERTKADTENG
ncbi:MAG: hypothetical protein IJU75_03120 [Clostridia bacterium]|nr:hypothetical protein [Clostridia bacterium]